MTNADEFGLFKEFFGKPGESPSLPGPAELDVSHQLVPGYEIVALLGKGGMGAVYRARQLSLDRVVALKLLSTDLSGDPEYVKRFLIEARTAGKLRHLNIVSALDCGTVKETRFMVMEFVEGKTLEATLKELGILNERVALQIIKQIAEGLEYAWRHGIIHRDIKPQNIMMTPDGTAKICDLGLCKSVRRDLRLTSTGYINCTPTHASPEQARGERSLDCGTDIYSLGITLYQLVTGGLPFEGASPADLFIKHATAPRVPPHERNPKVSRAVSDLILRMIDPDRQKRPATPGQVVEEIRRLLSAPTEASPSIAPTPDRKIAPSPGRNVLRAAAMQSAVPWEIGVQYRDKVAVVSLRGHLDDSFDREITRKLARIVEKGFAGIVVDLSSLAYMNSRGVSAFVAIMDDVRGKGGDVKLAGAKPQAMLVLERLGITVIIQHLPDVEKAIAAFDSPPTAHIPESQPSETQVELSHEAVPPPSPPLPPTRKEEERPHPPIVRTPPPADPRASASPPPDRKLVACLVSLVALLALTCTALVVLLLRPSPKAAPTDAREPGPNPIAAPVSQAETGKGELARRMESLRRFAATSPDPRAVLDRCKELRPSLLATWDLEELDAIAMRAEMLLASQGDQFLIEIRKIISMDRDFNRKEEVLSMINAGIRKDPRYGEVKKDYENEIELAVQASLIAARKAKAEGAAVSEQLRLYGETVRLAGEGPARRDAMDNLEALKDRARQVIPEELAKLKAQLALLVPDNYPEAYSLAMGAESRYPLPEWTGPVKKELQSLWPGCFESFNRLLGEAKEASGKGDSVTVRKLRERVVRWQIPGFLPEFDKANPGVRYAFLGVEADTKKVTPAGLALARVIPGGAADRAGIKGGDILVELESQRIATFDDLRAVILEKSPGDRLKVKVERDGKRMDFDCELGTAPDK